MSPARSQKSVALVRRTVWTLRLPARRSSVLDRCPGFPKIRARYEVNLIHISCLASFRNRLFVMAVRTCIFSWVFPNIRKQSLQSTTALARPIVPTCKGRRRIGQIRPNVAQGCATLQQLLLSRMNPPETADFSEGGDAAQAHPPPSQTDSLRS